ncbi:MAG: hypothetical protein Q9M11_03430 [Mariprofundaceae bacterium]|nr:hypothetical protein [Mariprofundaceae bacterium]
MVSVKERLFNTHTDTLIRVHTLNIDAGMLLIERIVSRYIVIPTDDLVVYVKGSRYPLESRAAIARYNGSSLVDNKPWHPFLAIPILLDLLEVYQYYHTEYEELFKRNPLQEAVRLYTVHDDATDTEIVLNYVPNMSTVDLSEVVTIFNTIYTDHLKPIFTEYPNNVYTMDLATNMYRMLQHDDIRAYRFGELLVAAEVVDDSC